MDAPPELREPLFFERIGKETVWGGRDLARDLAWSPPGPGPLGETWELSDLPGAESVVRGGPHAGRSLRELMERHSRRLLGRSAPSADGRFPLLVKLIETRQDLSVQVHPPDGFAAPGSGKSECWYFLDGTRPGTTVLCGLREGVGRAEFEPVAASRGVVDLLRVHAVRPDDFLFVPAGQPHAIRAGARLLEIQQASDLTYRLYDWDRAVRSGLSRPLQPEQALAVIDYEVPVADPFPPSYRATDDGSEAALLVQSPQFVVRALRIGRRHLFRERQFALAMIVTRGSGCLAEPAGRFPTAELRFGDLFLVPAGLGPFALEAGPEGLELVEATAR